MSYKLEKPYTSKQRADFITKYDHNQGFKIEETDTALYALEAWEKLENDDIINNTEQYEAEQVEKEKLTRILEIKSQLVELDTQAIRPLRAILTDCATDEDKEILKTIEVQANNLRAELSLLEK